MVLDSTWLLRIPEIIAILIVIIGMFMALKYYVRIKKIELELELREEFGTTLEEYQKDIKKISSMLDAGKSTNAVEKDFLDRLSEIEEMVVPLKENPKFSSTEYSLLQYQINKLNETREDLQNRLERMIEQNFNSFRSGYTIWMLIITMLFTFGIGLLIYLLPK